MGKTGKMFKDLVKADTRFQGLLTVMDDIDQSIVRKAERRIKDLVRKLKRIEFEDEYEEC